MSNKELEIVIRDAEPEDCQAIADLLGELGYAQSFSYTRKKIRALSKRLKDRILVAQKQDTVVGCLSLHIMPLLHRPGNLCRVTALIVTKSDRRMYIGRRLMEIAETYAQANDCSVIEITSGEHRTDAHCFYTQLGYEETSKRFIKSLPDRK
jgi:N-acetylglutamate synthase-like GNAT family acetyltransferase